MFTVQLLFAEITQRFLNTVHPANPTTR